MKKSKRQTKLSVNINKIATLRNARGEDLPDLIQVAKDFEKAGCHGITVHPRPDERHIRYRDVKLLKKTVKGEFNIEGYPNQKFINLVLKVKPHQVTLVPDPPEAITSNAGWDTIAHQKFLEEIVSTFKKKNIRVSIFMENHLKKIEMAKKIGCNRIEMYTGPYAKKFLKDKKKAILPYQKAAYFADQIGLEINAGHDLNLINLSYFLKKIPIIKEVSIGHALICDCLYYGIKETTKKYLAQLK